MDVEILRFSKLHISLVEKERCYKIENTHNLLLALKVLQLQNLGFALVGMKVKRVTPWIGGRQLVTIESSVDKGAISKTALRMGDSVKLDVPAYALLTQRKSKKGKQLPCGVVREMADSSMIVAVSSKCRFPRWFTGSCTVKKDGNNVMYNCTCTALASLANYGKIRPRLHDVLFNSAEPQFSGVGDGSGAQYFDNSPNEAQKNAVCLALSASEISLIHGPPGTGETHTLVEIIRQFVSQGKRVLVCGASNVSVDNIALRLRNTPDLSFVRFGNPARMMSSVIKHSLCSMQEQMRSTSSSTNPTKRLNRMSKKASSKAIFNSVSVVLSTLCGTGDNQLTALCPKFDVVIIDEASQATEGVCWIAAIQAEKLILAGDHHQLPPTVKGLGRNTGTTSDSNKILGLKLLVSMFERV
ncbi:hypothetical protein IW140_002985 [Coemansia sp. RSA 1813]|nr:hypothetical protein EV178_003812 [Coemansia sp. RSA 1646]KAJ1770588.1 hypothetical protein LPJ74_003037 [Coemansia sp. RSA 1843]KAJ2091413.1 hypothetical protein IW138_001872 [Coemansia sp. RSA 986]KAJ2212829.1 hypothetical protein EV179_004316 [Coemansia sp. RSA 487]KAJ2569577.1 hypothetical protein IW140_002985 [Coemansia sp. RSA 1813]